MEKRIMLWVIIGVLFIAVLLVTFKVGASNAGSSGSTGSAIDTSGWTENEIMNYEMHGTVPVRAQGIVSTSASQASSQMVGGC